MSVRKHLISVPMAILVCFACSTVPLVCAQESDAKQAEQADEKQVEEKQPSLSKRIDALLKDKNPMAARESLQEAIKAEPEQVKANSRLAEFMNLHQKIALGFYREGEIGEATEQLATSFDFVLEGPESKGKPFTLVSILRTMNLFGSRSGKEELVAKRLAQAVQYCRELVNDRVDVQVPLSNLVVMRARMLSREDKASAKEILVKQIETVDAINKSDDVTEQTIAAQFQLLAAAGSLVDDFDDSTPIATLFESGMKSFPDSERLLMEFANAEYSAISSLARSNAFDASKRLELALEKLSPHAEDNANLKRMIARIKSIERRIAASAKQQEMVGKPAPELQIDGWANVDEFNAEDLKGKVVLFDFWAVWCGPCLATFPHLREWREEFGDKGFEVVGITRYYNYEWDEDANKASRSQEEVDPEVERATVARFLQSMDMQHPTIFTPQDSTLQTEYGVTGIPHAVLVDREGNVQMVKVGSGQENADALHEKIKELIAK